MAFGVFGSTLSLELGLRTAASIVPSGEKAGIDRTSPARGPSRASSPLLVTSAPVFVLLRESTLDPPASVFVGAPHTV